MPPAKTYPFQIDPFQQIAINCMEANHSVLVAAHTSAGKTVVAEYAFAMALRDGARVVYTSPLKALSNQKYREFQEKFGDVGLITGDVVINPSASCLVMTTEILRSMLYRGSEVIREVSLVVYDEIHYLRDKERGVVWEESIILAPKETRFAFLSATLPNARDFAEWIAATHSSPCHVVYTDYRPTPLQHFLYPAGSQGIFLVVDDKNVFREDAFSKAIGALEDEVERARAKNAKDAKDAKDANGGNNGGGQQSDVNKLISMITERNLDPVIIFSFSKSECESLADQVAALEVNTAEEKQMVHAIYDSAVEVLSKEDRKLPEVVSIIKRIERGVGVHHSGMLPILKELTEILFQEGLIKVLFATETFSTGLNMPAKTVVFTHARKFDGGAFRWISSGEYTQMSGRAGRRGLDDKGTVILMIDSKMDPATAKLMLRGQSDPLYSEFHLTYPMLVNMMRVEGAKVEDLIKRSYRQFQSEQRIPALEDKVRRLEDQMRGIVIDDEHLVESYAGILDQYVRLTAARRDLVMHPKLVLPFLQPGRLVRVESSVQSSNKVGASAGVVGGINSVDDVDRRGAWAAVVNFEILGSKRDEAMDKRQKRRVVVDVLVMCDEADGPKDPTILADEALAVWPKGSSGGNGRRNGVPYVVPVDLDKVLNISTLRVHISKDLRTKEEREKGGKVLAEVRRRFAESTNPIPLLDPVKDMKLSEDTEYTSLVARLAKTKGMLESHPATQLCRGDDDDDDDAAGKPHDTIIARLQNLRMKMDIKHNCRILRQDIDKARGLVLEDDLRSRTRVLKRLGYVDDDQIISTKAKAAAEISTGDELVMCELLFNGAFGPLKVDQVAALVSCFIWREKAETRAKVPHDMEGAYGQLREAARKIAKAEAECDLGIDVEDYVSSFKPDLMAIVVEWCRGATFAHISSMAGDKTHGGSLVRAIRRLEELLRQTSGALKLIGDEALAGKFDLAVEKIKRDIIFAASLFL